MKLVLTPSRLKLLLHTGAGHISLNDNGEAVFRVPGHGTRKVTSAMDQLEYFGLVRVNMERTFVLTERGKEIMEKEITGQVI